MKQTLQLRIGQHLTMTPQLQQAIRLLQLSTLELHEEIQEALESNPMLELVEDDGGEQDQGATEGEGGETYANESSGANDEAVYEAPQPVERDDADRTPVRLEEADSTMSMTGDSNELAVDSVWEDVYENVLPVSHAADTEGREFDNPDSSSETLREHLLWQMHMTSLSEKDMAIATAIIDAINERGYLTQSLEEIHEALAKDSDVDLDEIGAVLHQVQNFDPIGVGARDLRECMLLQLQQFDPEVPWIASARELVSEHLELLAGREYGQLARRLKCSQQDLAEIIALVQSLNPRPGNLIADKKTEYIIPDVIVRKDRDAWRVELNTEAIPRVRINSGYASLVRRADNSSDNTYLRNHLQEARWFVKSLQSRNETLLRVASCIVERQRGFLEHGEEAMKALVLHDVAEAVGMHESTISRVTTQKYMHTPRGVFELKYFFSSHVSTANGGECSATAIRALIKKMVAGEDARKPLSDSKIADFLKEQGINVARRTIAKYREALAIPPSSERKRLI